MEFYLFGFWIYKKISDFVELEVSLNCLFKGVNVEIFLKATHSFHEGHHVGSMDVQSSRDKEIILIIRRDSEFKLSISRNMVYVQDHMAS